MILIGYIRVEETSIDVWQETTTERLYSANVLKSSTKWFGSEHLNDNITISNRLSILADPFAYENYQAIRYCTWNGAKWKVNSVEVAYPRLILELGGVYNEQTEAL